MDEKRVKRLMPQIKKLLHRDLDLLETSDLLDKYTNLKDSDKQVIEQIQDVIKRKGLV
jgi:hypothetical protein